MTRSRLRETFMCMCGSRWRLRQMPILADRSLREAFSSTRYVHLHGRDSLASTPNANSCGQVWAGRVLVYAKRSCACAAVAGVYAKCQFLRTGLCGKRSRLRDTLMCMCGCRWRLRQMPILADRFGRDAFSSTRYARLHVATSLASTPNANSCGQVYAPRVLVYAKRSCAC